MSEGTPTGSPEPQHRRGDFHATRFGPPGPFRPTPLTDYQPPRKTPLWRRWWLIALVVVVAVVVLLDVSVLGWSITPW